MKPLYNDIGKGYDTTRKADPEIARRLFHHLQLKSELVLDVACGTGNYTIAMQEMGLKMWGTDISNEMLKVAQSKSTILNWIQSDVMKMPFSDNQFEGATCTLAIHHFSNLEQSFNEVSRILKNRSRFVIFTSLPEQMEKYWLNLYFPEIMKRSIEQMPNLNIIKKSLEKAGFKIIGTETFMTEPNLQDFFLYSGKYRPEIYLDSNIRKGISSFATANEFEINQGLIELSKDLMNNEFEYKTKDFISEYGDYLFVVSEKQENIT